MHVILTGWFFGSAAFLIVAAFVAGYVLRSARQKVLDERAAERRRLRYAQGRPQPRGHGTAGNAKIHRVKFESKTGGVKE